MSQSFTKDPANLTGTGKVVLDTSPTIVTPTITGWTNANHTHAGVTTGGIVNLVTLALPVANVLTLTNAADCTLAMAVSAARTITITATQSSGITFTGASVLTIPATGTAALLDTANAFTNSQSITLSQNAATKLTISNVNAGNAANAQLLLTSDGGSSAIYRTSIAYSVATLVDSLVLQEAGGGSIIFYTAAEAGRWSNAGSLIVGTAAIATNATDGFLYIPTCAGAPTGTPTTYSGRVAMVYDTTNNALYIYVGTWVHAHYA